MSARVNSSDNLSVNVESKTKVEKEVKIGDVTYMITIIGKGADTVADQIVAQFQNAQKEQMESLVGKTLQLNPGDHKVYIGKTSTKSGESNSFEEVDEDTEPGLIDLINNVVRVCKSVEGFENLEEIKFENHSINPEGSEDDEDDVELEGNDESDDGISVSGSENEGEVEEGSEEESE